MPHELLRNNVQSNLPLTEAQLDIFCAPFEAAKVSKGDYLLRQGNICRFEGFVTHGCFRIFTIDNRGNENILYFAASGWWLIDTDSFMYQTASELNFQALEGSESAAYQQNREGAVVWGASLCGEALPHYDPKGTDSLAATARPQSYADGEGALPAFHGYLSRYSSETY